MIKITVGQFNESFPPIIDGVANVVENYAYWVNKKYGKCSVITPTCPNAVDDYEYEVKRYASVKVPLRGEYRFGLPKMDPPFWKDLKQVPFDIVHTHSPFAAGAAARSIAKKRGIPLVATFHSKFRDDFKLALKVDKIVDGVIAKIVAFYETADELWAVSESSIETLREYGYKGDVIVMQNGCDIKPDKPTQQVYDSVNNRYGFGTDEKVLVYVGQHTWQKNVELTINALKRAADMGHDFKMLFVGDGINRKGMEAMVEKLGLKNKVVFAGNIHDRQFLKNIYHRSSALLFPSFYDTSGIVIQEAAACCCPTVVAKGTIIASETTKENGYIVDNNPQSMADAIADIISDEQKRMRIGQNAYKTLFSSWEQRVDHAVERYKFLIDKKLF